MALARFTQGFEGGGLSFQQNFSVEADHPNPFDIDIPAAIAGNLTTRTDNDTGILTVPEGHGITTSHLVDLYDEEGVLIRKDMTVTGTTATTISIDLGTGSNLPPDEDPIIVNRQVLANAAIPGDVVKMLAMCLEHPGQGLSGQGRVIFEDDADADIAELTLTPNQPRVDNIAGGQANVLAGEVVAKMRICSPITTAGKFKLVAMEDSTP